MRVVLDTNTIISAILWGGIPWQVYQSALSEQYILLSSEILLDELDKVLRRPKFIPMLSAVNKSVDAVVTAHRNIVESVTPVELSPDVVRDPKDRAILACAIGGDAQYIVSGDKDLLVLHEFHKIPILNAARFLEHLANELLD